MWRMPGGSRDACTFDGLHRIADSGFSCGLKCSCSPPEIFRTVKRLYICSTRTIVFELYLILQRYRNLHLFNSIQNSLPMHLSGSMVAETTAEFISYKLFFTLYTARYHDRPRRHRKNQDVG
jgi:hypothetical protein